MPEPLSGATRVVFIAGDPIAQVKAPEGVTAALRARGVDAIVVPMHVAAVDFADFVRVATRARNVDGLIATVPHKFAAAAACAGCTGRARSIGAVNVMRRDAAGGWFGDMCDGAGFVEAVTRAGGAPAGRRALLVGAGGAGSAIAHALVDAGVAELALHDVDAARRDALRRRLESYGRARITIGSTDPHGHDLVCNATPLGMLPGDPDPVQVARLDVGTFVGDVVTVPAVPPLIRAARERGCATSTGSDMFACVRDLIADFLLERP